VCLFGFLAYILLSFIVRNADLSVFPHIHGAVMGGWSNRDRYEDELLDAYFYVEDADALYAEAANGVEFTRGLANMPWHSRESVVKGLRRPSARLRCELVTGFIPSLNLTFNIITRFTSYDWLPA
jgi:hypothetical protein